MGGAIRLNHGWKDYDPVDPSKSDLELVRVDLQCERGRFICSAQYRWYDGFSAVHHAWVGIAPTPDQQVRVGVLQAPFGLLPYASHSFWFGSGYYLGIEDDYDLGIAWTLESDTWRGDVALFASDEYGTGREDGRYSFDVATTPQHPFRERERLVGRIERTIESDTWTWRLGASLSLGEVERRPDGRRFDHRAGALHLEAVRGPLELETQWARYDYDVPGARIALTAFLFPFEIAARADVLTANAAWTFEPAGWFDAITCYNDYSTTRASGPGRADSVQNVTGCSFAKGVMFTYVDWIAGRNMWFVGGPGIGLDAPERDRWHSRLNVNVGFYF
ncbi:MAG: hypothetical protein KY442_11675 [Proteobacteria bacterium]|nr:hypothetical protein [Pseudomonadota bacterium]